jgi:hypothetical protein
MSERKVHAAHTAPKFVGNWNFSIYDFDTHTEQVCGAV